MKANRARGLVAPQNKNAPSTKSLRRLGLWLALVGRIVAVLGLGIFATIYYPAIAFPVWSLIGISVAFLVAGFIGLNRKTNFRAGHEDEKTNQPLEPIR